MTTIVMCRRVQVWVQANRTMVSLPPMSQCRGQTPSIMKIRWASQYWNTPMLPLIIIVVIIIKNYHNHQRHHHQRLGVSPAMARVDESEDEVWILTIFILIMIILWLWHSFDTIRFVNDKMMKYPQDKKDLQTTISDGERLLPGRGRADHACLSEAPQVKW